MFALHIVGVADAAGPGKRGTVDGAAYAFAGAGKLIEQQAQIGALAAARLLLDEFGKTGHAYPLGSDAM